MRWERFRWCAVGAPILALSTSRPVWGSEPPGEERAGALPKEALSEPETSSKATLPGSTPSDVESQHHAAPEMSMSARPHATADTATIALAVTSVGLGVLGTILGFATAARAREDAETQHRALLVTGLAVPCTAKWYLEACKELDAALDAESTFNVLGSASLAMTVVSGAVLTYVLTLPSSESPITNVRAGVWVGPGGGALTFVGSF